MKKIGLISIISIVCSVGKTQTDDSFCAAMNQITESMLTDDDWFS